MTPRNFGHQGKRDDQVSFSEVVAGLCVALLFIFGVGSCLLERAR